MAKTRTNDELELRGYRDDDAGLYYLVVVIEGAERNLTTIKLPDLDADVQEARQAAAEAQAQQTAAEQAAPPPPASETQQPPPPASETQQPPPAPLAPAPPPPV